MTHRTIKISIKMEQKNAAMWNQVVSILTKQRGYAASNERGSAEVKYQWKECV